MTTLFLIRHAAYDGLGDVVAGRTPGLHLSDEGREQAQRLSEKLARSGLQAIYSSPLERAFETAEAVARRVNLEVYIREPLLEIDYGEWTGRSIASLADDPVWRRFNSVRSLSRSPGGESMLEVQARFVTELESLSIAHAGARLAIVSHGDPIRAALLYYAGVHLDLFQRFEIGPASVSVVTLAYDGPKLLTVNNTDEVLAL